MADVRCGMATCPGLIRCPGATGSARCGWTSARPVLLDRSEAGALVGAWDDGAEITIDGKVHPAGHYALKSVVRQVRATLPTRAAPDGESR